MGQPTSHLSSLYWPGDVFILRLTSIGTLPMSRGFTRLCFKSRSCYPRERGRFSPGFTDAAGRTDPHNCRRRQERRHMSRSLLPLLVFVGLLTPVMVSGRWWTPSAALLPDTTERSPEVLPACGSPEMRKVNCSVTGGRLSISFPSMCESISVPMEDHVCHETKIVTVLKCWLWNKTEALQTKVFIEEATCDPNKQQKMYFSAQHKAPSILKIRDKFSLNSLTSLIFHPAVTLLYRNPSGGATTRLKKRWKQPFFLVGSHVTGHFQWVNGGRRD